ncbi:MAG TPA: DUF411 domain-containing protein [Gemmatimonadaceae bacterium]
MNRRAFIGVSLGAGAMITIAPSRLFAQPVAVKVTVYKSPTCGCCANWVSYMKDQSFDVDVVDLNDLSNIKSSWGVPEKLQSCHTALAGKYVIEGHVPADLVKKMLAERPPIVGLAVPGMPVDAPGMGDGSTPYEVMSWTKGGKAKVYATR